MILSDCPVIQVLNELSLYEDETFSDDFSEYNFACGCIATHRYDDCLTDDWYYNCKNCVLGYKPCKIDNANR